jgi:hypothetical protein
VTSREDHLGSGPICAFTAVEPCSSWRVVGNRQTQKLQQLRGMRQCLFVYHYWIDDFARAQTLMDEQLKTDWASALNSCVERIHPLFPELCQKYPMN